MNRAFAKPIEKSSIYIQICEQLQFPPFRKRIQRSRFIKKSNQLNRDISQNHVNPLNLIDSFVVVQMLNHDRPPLIFTSKKRGIFCLPSNIYNQGSLMINTRTYKGGTNDLSYQHCLLQLLPFHSIFCCYFLQGKKIWEETKKG